MSTTTSIANRRIIVIDDNAAIHDDFRKIFSDSLPERAALDAAEVELFGETPAAHNEIGFEIDSAYQGSEGLELVRRAVADGRPYAMAFVDVRMPPGWDGIETISRIWRIDSNLQVVICTAYSDYSWEELTAKLGLTDQFVILRKPFDTIEVLQLASAFTAKWNLIKELKRER